MRYPTIASQAQSTISTLCRRQFLHAAERQCPHLPRSRYSSSKARPVEGESPDNVKWKNVTQGLLTGLAFAAGWALHNKYGRQAVKSPSKTDPEDGLLPPSLRSTAPLDSSPRVQFDITEDNINVAKQELKKQLGADRIDDNVIECINRSSTAWSAAPRGELDRSAFIVFPSSTEEVSYIAKVCHRRRIPMIAFSGGTSLEGTLAAIHGGVCVDFKLMNNILALHKDDLDVIVQPAVGYEQLNEELSKLGLFFPPDPGPGAQIGGMIAQGCSGTNAYRYGTVKDWVLGLTVVLADGTIIRTRHRPRKSSSGFNLTQLMVGSEGLLGFVTEASLKVTSQPVNERVAVLSFPTTHNAVKTALKIMQHDLQLAAMEMLCDVAMKAVNRDGYCEQEYPEIPTLFLKFAGSDEVVREQIRMVRRFAAESQCKKFDLAESEEDTKALWMARKTALWSCMALKNQPSDGFLSSDSAVPLSKLADAVENARTLASKSGFTSFFVGHLGDGNFHTGILYPATDEAKARALIKQVQRDAIRLEGTVSGEHGIGLEYREMLVEELGQGSVDTMRQIKLALDPLCLLNPDKMFKLNIGVPECSTATKD